MHTVVPLLWVSLGNKTKSQKYTAATPELPPSLTTRGGAGLQDAQLVLVAAAQPAESRGAAQRVL